MTALDSADRRARLQASSDLRYLKKVARRHNIPMRRRQTRGDVVFDLGPSGIYGAVVLSDEGRVTAARLFGVVVEPTADAVAAALEFGLQPDDAPHGLHTDSVLVHTTVEDPDTGPINLPPQTDASPLMVVSQTPPSAPRLPMTIRSISIQLVPTEAPESVSPAVEEQTAVAPPWHNWTLFTGGLALFLQVFSLVAVPSFPMPLAAVWLVVSVVLAIIGAALVWVAIEDHDQYLAVRKRATDSATSLT